MVTAMDASLVLANARIGPSPDLVAIALDNDRIHGIRPVEDAPSGPTVDLEGRTVLPGIDDSHLHAYEYGRSLTATDLGSASSVEQLQQILRAARPETTGWYRGHGWESTSLSGSGDAGRLTAADIDDCTPHGPALLGDSTGHAALCNTRALVLAGITRATPDPAGGVIVRDSSGEPTGLLLEAAVSLAAQAMPDISTADRREAILAAQQNLLSRGVVAVTDPGLGPGGTTLMDGTGTLDAVRAYQDLDEHGRLLLRTHVMLLFGGLGGTTADAVAIGLDAWGSPSRAPRDRRLSIDQVKVFADGIPRSRTAWLREPYDDCTHGHMTVAGETNEERVAELHAIVSAASARGWQVGTHCTGDATIGAFVDAVEATGTGPTLRHYVIHGDLISDADLDRLPGLAMTLNTNPSIRWTVGRRVSPIIGDARNLAKQPLRRAHDRGVNVVASSDAPVVPPDWRTILAAAMTRAMKDDPDYTDSQVITATEAVDAMTRNAAWQSHEEAWRGRLAPGLAADLVVLDDEVDWSDPWSLTRTETSATVIDGIVVHGALS